MYCNECYNIHLQEYWYIYIFCAKYVYKIYFYLLIFLLAFALL